MHQLNKSNNFSYFFIFIALPKTLDYRREFPIFQVHTYARSWRFRISGCLEDQSSIQYTTDFTVCLNHQYSSLALSLFPNYFTISKLRNCFSKLAWYLFSALELICSNCNETTSLQATFFNTKSLSESCEPKRCDQSARVL